MVRQAGPPNRKDPTAYASGREAVTDVKNPPPA